MSSLKQTSGLESKSNNIESLSRGKSIRFGTIQKRLGIATQKNSISAESAFNNNSSVPRVSNILESLQTLKNDLSVSMTSQNTEGVIMISTIPSDASINVVDGYKATVKPKKVEIGGPTGNLPDQFVNIRKPNNINPLIDGPKKNLLRPSSSLTRSESLQNINSKPMIKSPSISRQNSNLKRFTTSEDLRDAEKLSLKNKNDRSFTLAVIGAKTSGKSNLIKTIERLILRRNLEDTNNNKIIKDNKADNKVDSSTLRFKKGISLHLKLKHQYINVNIVEIDVNTLIQASVDQQTRTLLWPRNLKPDAAILCYDVTNRASFMCIPELLHMLEEENLSMILVGLQNDFRNQQRQVDHALGYKTSALFNTQFVELNTVTVKGIQLIEKEIIYGSHGIIQAMVDERVEDLLRTTASRFDKDKRNSSICAVVMASPAPSTKSEAHVLNESLNSLSRLANPVSKISNLPTNLSNSIDKPFKIDLKPTKSVSQKILAFEKNAIESKKNESKSIQIAIKPGNISNLKQKLESRNFKTTTNPSTPLLNLDPDGVLANFYKNSNTPPSINSPVIKTYAPFKTPGMEKNVESSELDEMLNSPKDILQSPESTVDEDKRERAISSQRNEMLNSPKDILQSPESTVDEDKREKAISSHRNEMLNSPKDILQSPESTVVDDKIERVIDASIGSPSDELETNSFKMNRNYDNRKTLIGPSSSDELSLDEGRSERNSLDMKSEYDKTLYGDISKRSSTNQAANYSVENNTIIPNDSLVENEYMANMKIVDNQNDLGYFRETSGSSKTLDKKSREDHNNDLAPRRTDSSTINSSLDDWFESAEKFSTANPSTYNKESKQTPGLGYLYETLVSTQENKTKPSQWMAEADKTLTKDENLNENHSIRNSKDTIVASKRNIDRDSKDTIVSKSNFDRSSKDTIVVKSNFDRGSKDSYIINEKSNDVDWMIDHSVTLIENNDSHQMQIIPRVKSKLRIVETHSYDNERNVRSSLLSDISEKQLISMTNVELGLFIAKQKLLFAKDHPDALRIYESKLSHLPASASFSISFASEDNDGKEIASSLSKLNSGSPLSFVKFKGDSVPGIIQSAKTPAPETEDLKSPCNVDEMINRLTSGAIFDTELSKCFLLVYRIFISPLKLMDYLIDRFLLFDKENRKSKETGKLLIHHVQLRICNMMVNWISNYKDDDFDHIAKESNSYLKKEAPESKLQEDNPALIIIKFYNFIETLCAKNETFQPICIKLLRPFILKVENPHFDIPMLKYGARKVKPTTNNQKSKLSNLNASTIKYAWPILPPTWASINYTIEELFFSIDDNSESQTLDKFGRNLMVDGIHPYNIAVTITHIQMGHFVAIRSRELIERSLKKEENLLSPLGKMLLSSQKITLWIITTILAITDLHTRSIVFSRFIEAAWILLIQFHNYNGTWLIVEALNSPSLIRLMQTREYVKTKLTLEYPLIKEPLLPYRQSKKSGKQANFLDLWGRFSYIQQEVGAENNFIIYRNAYSLFENNDNLKSFANNTDDIKVNSKSNQDSWSFSNRPEATVQKQSQLESKPKGDTTLESKNQILTSKTSFHSASRETGFFIPIVSLLLSDIRKVSNNLFYTPRGYSNSLSQQSLSMKGSNSKLTVHDSSTSQNSLSVKGSNSNFVTRSRQNSTFGSFFGKLLDNTSKSQEITMINNNKISSDSALYLPSHDSYRISWETCSKIGNLVNGFNKLQQKCVKFVEDDATFLNQVQQKSCPESLYEWIMEQPVVDESILLDRSKEIENHMDDSD